MSENKTEAKPSKDATNAVLLLNNQPRLEMIKDGDEMVVILPGLNIVDAAALQRMRKNPAFNEKFETKIRPSRAKEAELLRVGEPMLEQGPAVQAQNPLARIPDAEARELVNRINDEDLLDRILGVEGRGEIRAALDQRKKFLKTGAGAESEDAA